MRRLDPRDQLYVLSNFQPFATPNELACGGHVALMLRAAESSDSLLLNNRRVLLTRSGISAAAAKQSNPYREYALSTYAAVWHACNEPDPLEQVRTVACW